MIRDVFEDTYNYMKSGIHLRQVINKLNEIDFNNSKDLHLFGQIYETFLSELQSAGTLGEFYTPRAVTQFMTEMVNPKHDETVLDPACGTGGFLTAVIEHLKSSASKIADREAIAHNVRGWEYKPLPYILANTNLILHDIITPNVQFGDSLQRPLSEYSRKDRVDVIIANPPFGGVVSNNNENNFPQTYRTKESADLFLILIIHLLKDGGRAAVVLPDGFLFGEGMKSRLKEKLLEECNLHTIVRLPNGVFIPYTGIKTNLLFFTKGRPTREVWFYEHQYPAGVKNYSKTRPMRVEEFKVEEAWWGSEADGFAARVENERAWKVSIDQIKAANYNLDQKNPHAAEVVSHDPEQLLADYARLQTEAQSLRDQLKSILAQSLGAPA